MADVGSLYRQGRERIAGLVRDADPEQLGATVPACPEWSVHDVVAHLSGVCADVINGNIEGVASDPWTAAQVDARRDWPIAKVLEEWDEYAPQCEAICHMFPDGSDVQWLGDLTTHEHDIRSALGRPGERDSEALRVAYPWLAERFGRVLSARGLPALRFVAEEGEELIAGEDEPAATVTASRFDLFRALTGRRSLEQIDEFGWDGDRGERFSFEWGPFRPAPSRIAE